MNRFWCKLAHFRSVGQGRETVNFGGQEVKGQGHARPKLDLEPGWGIILDPRRVE